MQANGPDENVSCNILHRLIGQWELLGGEMCRVYCPIHLLLGVVIVAHQLMTKVNNYYFNTNKLVEEMSLVSTVWG